jgi:hypothetical protein
MARKTAVEIFAERFTNPFTDAPSQRIADVEVLA